MVRIDLQQHLYSQEDLNRAYNKGKELAVVILEKSMGLSQKEQLYLIGHMKKKLMEYNARDVMKK